MAIDLKTVAEEIYDLAAKDKVKKMYKPDELFNAVMKQHESENISRKDCKTAIRILIDDGRLYYNGTYFETPLIEETAMSEATATAAEN